MFVQSSLKRRATSRKIARRLFVMWNRCYEFIFVFCPRGSWSRALLPAFTPLHAYPEPKHLYDFLGYTLIFLPREHWFHQCPSGISSNSLILYLSKSNIARNGSSLRFGATTGSYGQTLNGKRGCFANGPFWLTCVCVLKWLATLCYELIVMKSPTEAHRHSVTLLRA